MEKTDRRESAMKVHVEPLGDHAVVVRFGTSIDPHIHGQVKQFSASLEQDPLPGMVEYIPAYATVTVFYDPVAVYERNKGWQRTDGGSRPPFSPYEWYCGQIRERLNSLGEAAPASGRVVKIPVLYGGEMGPDLGEVARHNNLTEQEVIETHASGDYQVYMIGFAPGFPYIGGMPEKIATPRRQSPRLSIPAGSVGIAGKQTGIYPLETPGGWQIIGRTPLRLFRPEADPPSLLQAGDRVRFVPVTEEEFRAYEEGSA
jgi:inhibitor of KinA